MMVNLTKYRDLKSDMNVKIENVFLFDRMQPPKLFSAENLNLALALISKEDCVIQPRNVLT
jgi:hypothetical protein